ncbi:uncharacterized protein LOC143034225 [Oratosquilla oratoria]|uniref:uncharacterized protein LOC143034225 n=1 Tax=Oratosquilla oratoria TaxID=337810 RepID=UPI003F75C1A6
MTTTGRKLGQGIAPFLSSMGYQKSTEKTFIPLRAIVAFRDSPTYRLASHLAKFLRPIVTNSPHMLQNSTDFIEIIKGLKLRRDVLVFFDITSIARDLAKEALKSVMEETPGFLVNQKLTLSELMGLVFLCLDSTYFRFRVYIYHQRKGTLMGSPLSVVVVEVAMQRLEPQLLSAAPSSLKLWTRYVDDVHTILDGKGVEPFFNHTNSTEAAIQFSIELEKDDQLPFLDVNVKHEGDTLRTNVYRKSTHTDRVLDCDSHRPDCHKMSVIKTLWNRADKVRSAVESKKAERNHLLQVFRDNGYPNRTIRASEVTARVLRDNGVQVTHKPLNTLHRNLTKVKDTEEHTQLADVVYRIGCSDCDMEYIESQKKLASRVQEHQRAYKGCVCFVQTNFSVLGAVLNRVYTKPRAALHEAVGSDECGAQYPHCLLALSHCRYGPGRVYTDYVTLFVIQRLNIRRKGDLTFGESKNKRL